MKDAIVNVVINLVSDGIWAIGAFLAFRFFKKGNNFGNSEYVNEKTQSDFEFTSEPNFLFERQLKQKEMMERAKWF